MDRTQELTMALVNKMHEAERIGPLGIRPLYIYKAHHHFIYI
jgi:hypothetical protein